MQVSDDGETLEATPDELRVLMVRAVDQAARLYMRRYIDEDGGRLHVVLADGNIEDAWLGSALDECLAAEDQEGVTLCGLLAALTEPERLHISEHIYDRIV